MSSLVYVNIIMNFVFTTSTNNNFTDINICKTYLFVYMGFTTSTDSFDLIGICNLYFVPNSFTTLVDVCFIHTSN